MKPGRTGIHSAVVCAPTDVPDPQRPAAPKDHRLKASRDVIARSLRGDWRAEHLFTLKQTHTLWQQHQTLIAACDAQIAAPLQTFDARVDVTAASLPPAKTSHKQAQRNEPQFAAKFPTAKHFGNWLGPCPDNRITGGKIYSVRTRDVKSRVAEALRLAAQSLWRAQNYFGDLYRR